MMTIRISSRCPRPFVLRGDALQAATEDLIDIDSWMRTYAFFSLTGNWDVWGFGFEHNIYMYRRPSDQKFVLLPWDMDFSFDRATTESLYDTSTNIGPAHRPAGESTRFLRALARPDRDSRQPGILGTMGNAATAASLMNPIRSTFPTSPIVTRMSTAGLTSWRRRSRLRSLRTTV